MVTALQYGRITSLLHVLHKPKEILFLSQPFKNLNQNQGLVFCSLTKIRRVSVLVIAIFPSHHYTCNPLLLEAKFPASTQSQALLLAHRVILSFLFSIEISGREDHRLKSFLLLLKTSFLLTLTLQTEPGEG